MDPRDVFLRELDLPLGPERERVFDGDREYTLRGSESRTWQPSARSVLSQPKTSAIPTIGRWTSATANCDTSAT